MAEYIWSPGIYNGSVFKQIPRPIKSLRIIDSADYYKDKVPLRDGEFSTGGTFNGTVVEIEGELAIREGDVHFTEEQMWLLYKEVRELSMLNANDAQFEFFIYYNAEDDVYQKFKKGRGINLAADFGDDNHIIFTYTLSLFFDDPVIYDTPPGA